MAMVSGQTVSSLAELNALPVAYAGLSGSAEDSDDEYAYVSSLAEQIAHTLMLEDDEEPALAQPSPPFLPLELQQQQHHHHHYQATAWPSPCPLREQELEATSAEAKLFAAAWQDNAPAEWDCFRAPSLQQTSKHLSIVYTRQLEVKCNRRFQEWNAARLAQFKQVASYAPKSWDSSHFTAYYSASSVRKESIGTGVFLPKITNSGPHYRRKAGFLSSRSAHAPRHKC